MNPPAAGHDEFFMAEALREASKGQYSSHPNPNVGCVIVRDGEIVARGFHARAGGPHAEIVALEQLPGRAARGCTVYVTLEPCSHTGRTPPCADALVQAEPRRVVVAMQDPNPRVAGRGIERLRAAGIEVETGLLEAEARRMHAAFVKRMEQGLPWLRVKMAMSLDGRTALHNGLSQWITGPEARRDVQFLRARASAVLSSARTVIDDDASLNVRLSSDELGQSIPVRQPLRVILDTRGELTGQERLFDVPGPILVVGGEATEFAFAEREGLERLRLPTEATGRVDLRALMQTLAEREINEVHSECGRSLAGALLQAGLVDELKLYLAPSLLGDAARGAFDLGEIDILSDRQRLEILEMRPIGRDIRITARPQTA